MRMPSSPEPLRIAFLGCGFITRVHSRHLKSFRRDVVCSYPSRDGVRAEAYRRRYGGARSYSDYTAAIELDENFGSAYNNRCLTRAIAGQDLLQALADCDVALRLMPVNLDVRDTRGFIYLKLGDPALALNEYNAALQRDPNRATALFGRGLARIRSGDIRGGEGDQAAARTVNPEVDQQFAVFGLN